MNSQNAKVNIVFNDNIELETFDIDIAIQDISQNEIIPKEGKSNDRNILEELVCLETFDDDAIENTPENSCNDIPISNDNIAEVNNEIDEENQNLENTIDESDISFRWEEVLEQVEEKRKKNKNAADSVPDADKCGLCTYSSSDKISLKDHLEGHKADKILACQLCEFTGNDFADMIGHRSEHFTNKKFNPCHLCGKRFFLPYRLRLHYKIDHLLPCMHCGLQKYHKPFCKIYMEKHLAKFMCETCGLRCKTKGGLTRHLSVSHKMGEVKCSHCNELFMNDKAVKRHMEKIRKATPYKCDVCPRRYPSEKLLRSHRSQYSDPFACHLCEAKFKKRSPLMAHVKTHLYTILKCEHCSFNFINRTHFIRHRISSLTNPATCKYCAKKFCNKSQLARHCLRQHRRYVKNRKRPRSKNSLKQTRNRKKPSNLRKKLKDTKETNEEIYKIYKQPKKGYKRRVKSEESYKLPEETYEHLEESYELPIVFYPEEDYEKVEGFELPQKSDDLLEVMHEESYQLPGKSYKQPKKHYDPLGESCEPPEESYQQFKEEFKEYKESHKELILRPEKSNKRAKKRSRKLDETSKPGTSYVNADKKPKKSKKTVYIIKVP